MNQVEICVFCPLYRRGERNISPNPASKIPVLATTYNARKVYDLNISLVLISRLERGLKGCMLQGVLQQNVNPSHGIRSQLGSTHRAARYLYRVVQLNIPPENEVCCVVDAIVKTERDL